MSNDQRVKVALIGSEDEYLGDVYHPIRTWMTHVAKTGDGRMRCAVGEGVRAARPRRRRALARAGRRASLLPLTTP